MKRYLTKYVRDGAKAAYKKGSECYICKTSQELDFHHYTSLAELVNKWQAKNRIVVETEEDAYKYRDMFIEEHRKELYDDAVTLCHTHHQKLHSIYGKNPSLATAKKQARWVERQREKHYGLV